MSHINNTEKGALKKEKRYKYIHYLSYMANSNITGVFVINSNWKKIDTETKLKDCEKIIKGNLEDVTNCTIVNILTVKNK